MTPHHIIRLAGIVGPDPVAFGIATYQVGVVAISLGLVVLAGQMLRMRAGGAGGTQTVAGRGRGGASRRGGGLSASWVRGRRRVVRGRVRRRRVSGRTDNSPLFCPAKSAMKAA